MQRLRTPLLALVVAVDGLALAACAPGANDVAASGAGEPAGFWLGLWYNFGFVLGLSVVFGSGSRASTPRRSVRSSR